MIDDEDGCGVVLYSLLLCHKRDYGVSSSVDCGVNGRRWRLRWKVVDTKVLLEVTYPLYSTAAISQAATREWWRVVWRLTSVGLPISSWFLQTKIDEVLKLEGEHLVLSWFLFL